MVLRKRTLDSFYKKNVGVICSDEETPEDEIANWLAAQQEEDEKDEEVAEETPRQTTAKVQRVNCEEYSPTKDVAFCFPCFLFSKKPVGKIGSNAFIVKGFRSWKKVNDRSNCAFMIHMGKDCDSAHKYNVQCYENLKNQPCHIVHAVEKQTNKEIKKNRLRLRTSIDAVRWLAFQACYDEFVDSKNQGNFLEMVKLLASYDDKRNDDLHDNQVAEMEHLIELNELETGSGANQIRTLHHPEDTRWSSHYDSICSLLKLYKPTFLVLKDIATAKGSGSTLAGRAKAAGAVKLMMSFDFVFILHVMKELMGITDLLCKKLQQKTQDIVNVMDDVATTKKLIQSLSDRGWSALLNDVTSFCIKQGIQVPNMNAFYADYIRSRAENELSVEHHYKYDIFTVAIDQQLHELNSRFSEQATELLVLCTSLDPRDSFRSFKIDDICLLASKFYPTDFLNKKEIT
ncbi:unnamed protein product [Miscanthus lutarioriparius]|uniref:TTF-type domain-containing protein n=1 Tax=Miscanthus lutarioriparius TaxID=422564 RepID=A0A811RX60_9POAL|nr:unnamed protein product [Miscanthus lutarioriparius]